MADGLGWWRFLPVLQKHYGWKCYNHNVILIISGFIYLKQPSVFITICHLPIKMLFFEQDSAKNSRRYTLSLCLRGCGGLSGAPCLFTSSSIVDLACGWGECISRREGRAAGVGTTSSPPSPGDFLKNTWKQPEDEYAIICYSYIAINSLTTYCIHLI